ncbi:ccr4 associated factor [Coemansia sp. RSA 2599]|nr:ccr4 associated factor [Coemansia sp. RSA 2598]KAJ1827159.1 ccr4 associated factor [Coemansia sp. RSA 2599]
MLRSTVGRLLRTAKTAQIHRLFSTTPHFRNSSTPADDIRQLETLLDKSDQYARVAERAVLEISGRDASEFLQGMQCNSMRLVDEGGPGMLTGFLLPQGRMLADAFIYPKNAGVNFPHPVFLVEIDAHVKQRVLKTLQFYKLRAQIAIRDASSEYDVWSVWGPGSAALVGSQGQPISHVPRGSLVFKGETSAVADVWLSDARAPGMGLRLLLPAYKAPQLPGGFEERGSDDYKLRRVLKGVAEGSSDFVADVSVPLECNMDYMRGVHFSKGCYVGQELTIRTHHRGVVRKRIVPVLYSPVQPGCSVAHAHMRVDRSFPQTQLPAPQADIVRVAEQAPADAEAREQRPSRVRKVPPGKTGSAVCNAGLALMRLEHVEQHLAQPAAATLQTVGADGTRLAVSPWCPSWWPASAA